MLNRETRASAGTRRTGTVIGPPETRARASRALPPIIRHRLRKVQGGTSSSASFIIGQFRPQVMVSATSRTMPAGASDPPAACRAGASIGGAADLAATDVGGSGLVPAPGSAPLITQAPAASEVGAPPALLPIAEAGRLGPRGSANLGHGRLGRTLALRWLRALPDAGVFCLAGGGVAAA